MNKFFFNKKLVISLVAIIVSFVLVAVSISVRNNRSTPSFIQQFGNDAAAFVDRVIAYPAQGVKSVSGTLDSLINTYSENQQLKKKVNELAQQKATNATIKKENKQLKQQLKLTKTLTNYTKINAYVLTRTPSAWQNQVTISKGSASGVVKGAAVVSSKGLVGRVTEVNKTSSKVELISSNNDSANRFAVSVTNTSGKTVNGIITSYNSTNNYLVMGEITSQQKVKAGTKVTTSGLGGNSAKGLLVGTVVKVKSDDSGLTTKIYIKPAADLDDLSIVSVIKRAS